MARDEALVPGKVSGAVESVLHVKDRARCLYADVLREVCESMGELSVVVRARARRSRPSRRGIARPSCPRRQLVVRALQRRSRERAVGLSRMRSRSEKLELVCVP